MVEPFGLGSLDVVELVERLGTVDSATVQQLISTAAGIDATRGDTVAVAAMPFNTGAAQAAKDALAASAAADRSAKQSSLLKTAALVAVVLILMFLAWRASRRSKKRKSLSPGELRHLEEMQAALEQRRLAELNSAIPTSLAIESPGPGELARDERQREIEQMVQEQPEEMAALLRGWLGAN